MKRILYFFPLLAVALLITSGCNHAPKDGIHTITVCTTTDLHGV